MPLSTKLIGRCSRLGDDNGVVCSSGGGVPVECHAREGGGLLRRWEDTVKRCSCREYASLQRGGEREKVKVRVGEKKRRKGRKKKKKKRRLALAGASRDDRRACLFGGRDVTAETNTANTMTRDQLLPSPSPHLQNFAEMQKNDRQRTASTALFIVRPPCLLNPRSSTFCRVE